MHQMNHSIYSVNRTTHLKIVVITLALAIAVANLAIDLLKNRYRGRDQGRQHNQRARQFDGARVWPTPPSFWGLSSRPQNTL